MDTEQIRGRRYIGYWLIACCAVLFVLAIVGAVTRLTESGLSMVHWQPITGIFPPLNEGEWKQVFDAYRESPEYREVNAGMSLADFKFIFWFEYVHRVVARLLGFLFIVPLGWFGWKRWISKSLALHLGGVLALGGLQGYMGWYMVQSGLVDIPRVSPYRLAFHLGLALIIFSWMVVLALGLLKPGRSGSFSDQPRWMGPVLLFFAGSTITWGALVAGLDAGLAYNTFPKMGGAWVPSGLSALDPGGRNLFENPTTVQFIHRILGVTTVSLAVGCWAWSWSRYRGVQRIAFDLVGATALIQLGLGITTLLYLVPVSLGAAHQAGAILLLTSILLLIYSGRRARRVA